MYTRMLVLSQFPYTRLSVELYQNKEPMLPLQESEEWATLFLRLDGMDLWRRSNDLGLLGTIVEKLGGLSLFSYLKSGTKKRTWHRHVPGHSSLASVDVIVKI